MEPTQLPYARHAADYTARAHTPYSGVPEAAVVVLSDGTWVPGVRVESASYSLVIPALVNAYTTALAAGRDDVVGMVLDRDAKPGETAFLSAMPQGTFEPLGPRAWSLDGAPLPDAGAALDPFLDAPLPEDAAAGVALAHRVAERAYVPESAFPVGCVLVTDGGRLVPGVNVEHADWRHVLCAERNALGTAVTYDAGRIRAGYLSCPRDAAGSPCGACRQLLVELAPEAALWMDRGAQAPDCAGTKDLLPGYFSGQALLAPR